MRRRRGRAGPGDPAEPTPERQDPLQAAVDRYSHRAGPPDAGQQPAAGRQQDGVQPQPYQYPQSPGRHGSYPSPDADRDTQAYHGRHSPAAQEPHQGQQPYPGQQANPGQQPYPAEQAYPGQRPYQGQQEHPGEQRYPGQQPYPGEQRYPGQQPHPGEQRYQGQQPYPGDQRYSEQQPHPGQDPYQRQRPPGVFPSSGDSDAQYRWLPDRQPYGAEPPLPPPPPSEPRQPAAA